MSYITLIKIDGRSYCICTQHRLRTNDLDYLDSIGAETQGIIDKTNLIVCSRFDDALRIVSNGAHGRFNLKNLTIKVQYVNDLLSRFYTGDKSLTRAPIFGLLKTILSNIKIFDCLCRKLSRTAEESPHKHIQRDQCDKFIAHHYEFVKIIENIYSMCARENELCGSSESGDSSGSEDPVEATAPTNRPSAPTAKRTESSVIIRNNTPPASGSEISTPHIQQSLMSSVSGSGESFSGRPLKIQVISQSDSSTDPEKNKDKEKEKI